MRFPCILALALAPLSLPAQQQDTLPPDQDPQVFVKKGIAFNLKGDFDSAIDAFNKALQLDPQYAPAFENRGEARMKQGELVDAIADFTQTLKLQPENQAALFHRAQAESSHGDFDSAITDFDHTIQLQPHSSEAFLDRAQAKYFKGDPDGTISDASQALALNPGLVMARFIRGLAYGDKGDTEKAAGDFQQAARSGMAEAAFWFWAAKMEGHQSQAADPTNLLQEALGGKPDAWLTELADFVMQKTTDTELLSDAQKGKPDENRPVQAWFFVGLSRSFSGDANDARQAFQQVITIGDKNSYLTLEARRQLKNLSP